MSLIPGSPEWLANIEKMRVEESMQPVQWWWLSFGAPGKGNWLGGCFVQARGFTLALDETIRLGINPGGECRGEPVGVASPGPMVNRLLSKDDLEMERW